MEAMIRSRGHPPPPGIAQTTLLPSIMPVSQVTLPQSASKPYHPPAVFDRSRLELLGGGNKRRVEGSPSRNALSTVDYNTGRAKHQLPSTAIPKPASQHDVFAASTPTQYEYSSQQPRKRRPDVNQASTSKRARVEVEQKPEWTARWLKSFPTLIFHFESGVVEDAAGRAIRQRIARLGAKVEPFFSLDVTHLIVRAGGSPSKNSNSLLVKKAVEMGIKVWPLKKLAEILSNVSPVELAAADSLRTLLEDERLHGTRERDLSAPRPDHYYFKPGNKYTLIEDATGRHRPIMAKEYPPTGKDGSEWPVLYESFLRISATSITDTPVDKLRDRAWSLYVDHQPFEDERPPGELRRTTSMRNITGTPSLPQPAPYQIASGNSVVITSNIASTSNANPSPNPLGMMKDRAMMKLDKRVQVLKGNARLAARRNQPNDIFAPPQRRASTGMPLQQKTFITQDQVVKMLRQAREPFDEGQVSKEMRMANRDKVYGQKGKDQDTAPGYCENCRLRYSDLSIHLTSKKHRRFALADHNFTELDELLETLQRPELLNSSSETERSRDTSPMEEEPDTDGVGDEDEVYEVWEGDS